MRCDFRTERACDCPIGTCRSDPVATAKAPKAIPEKRDWIAFYVFLAVLAGIGLQTAHALKQGEIQHQLEARV